MNMTLVDSSLYITGSDPVSLHAVLVFNLGSSEGTILDLASLQFGNVGRGFEGKGLFSLEPVKQYKKRLEEFAQRNTFDNPKLSHRINSHTTPNNEWLKKVAKRAKARWDNRDKVHWCGHCGAPPLGGDLISCPSCNNAWYCNEDHKSAAWPFHKHFCE
ncbi:hypothetical protein BDN70DRAFT_935818 [Pholiota conissans]|uniref:MYND-type domain-containing protein n=1 Tax=Pholiota conissans TaxID=109636 RepID=A0A9P5YVW2_9AGAR|nr:hypothetical protein BDN70DRAFT_935818 [Pholiota conissans]